MKRSRLFIVLFLIIFSLSCKEKNKDGVVKIDYYEINNYILYPVLDTLVILEEKGYSKLINVKYDDSIKELSFTIYENTYVFNQNHVNILSGVFEYKGFLFYFWEKEFDNRHNWIRNTGKQKDIKYQNQNEWFIGDMNYYNFKREKDKFVLTESKRNDIISEN